MTFEFLVACLMGADNDLEDIRELLAKTLRETYESVGSYQNQFEEAFLYIRYTRQVVQTAGERGNTLLGFALEIPEDVTDEDEEIVESAISDFVASLQDNPPFSHAVKFEDPLLQRKLSKYAIEIFALEMKLRRVLSFIYLNAYRLREPFSLLVAERVRPPPRERLTPDQMKNLNENQFFRLEFRDYINLNQRSFNNVEDVLNIISSSDSFEELRHAIQNRPVSHENDVSLISSLRTIMDPIEEMRNCVAHNRHPTEDVLSSYPNARDQLSVLLDDYLVLWDVNLQGL